MTTHLTPANIAAAAERIRPWVRRTPLLPAPALAGDLHAGLALKLENLQVSGSFKARGAFNHLLQLDAGQRARGVIAASGGNHGLAVAYAGARLGVPVAIYLPEAASADRVARVQAWGAEVVRHGRNFDDAHAAATARAAAEGRAYIHPFDAERTLEGTATLGAELLEDVPDADAVLIAIGGGGLIAGMAAAIKLLRPDVRVLGVEPVGAPSMSVAVEAGRVVELERTATIADTLAPRAVSERTRSHAAAYVDQIALVDDAAMVRGMRWLWRECNQLVEPAGAAVIAAIQSGALEIGAYRRPVALICGGNAATECVFSAYGG